MRINQKHFSEAADESVKEELRVGRWRYYPGHYLIEETNQGEKYVYAPSSKPNKKEYSPLVDTPGLFLEFAGLGVESKGVTEKVWLEWVNLYGVLGLERTTLLRDAIRRYQELGLGLDDLMTELDDLDEDKWIAPCTEGGPRESFRNFRAAVHEARVVLTLYEAATAPGGPDMAVLEKYRSEIFGWELLDTTPDEARDVAIAWVVHLVQMKIAEECYPALYGDVDRPIQGWGFHSLLGAMYLQMMWLITATGEIRRCKGPDCTRVITFEQPKQPAADPGLKKNARGKYKTRVDKKYCSTNCRVKGHYHNKTKPGKKSGHIGSQ